MGAWLRVGEMNTVACGTHQVVGEREDDKEGTREVMARLMRAQESRITSALHSPLLELPPTWPAALESDQGVCQLTLVVCVCVCAFSWCWRG